MLFIQSLESGIIPECLKRAAIVTIYKSGDKSLPSNYPPNISHSNLNSSQSGGFRPKFRLKNIFTENHDFQSTYVTYIALLYLI